MSDTSSSFEQSSAAIRRRSFLKYAGAATSAAALVLAGCGDDTKDDPTPAITEVEVGAADNGVLNYAYALKQLELTFYLRLRSGAYYTTLATAAEKQVLDDVLKHEKTHNDFLKTIIPSTSLIKILEVDFGTIDFATRQGVLSAAMLFEDLGVAAINGAARYVTTPLTLLTLGKIVSVEARHAALIRDLLNYGSFAGNDVVESFAPAASGIPGEGTGTGLERSKTPAQVLALVNPYLKEGSKLKAASLV